MAISNQIEQQTQQQQQEDTILTPKVVDNTSKDDAIRTTDSLRSSESETKMSSNYSSAALSTLDDLIETRSRTSSTVSQPTVAVPLLGFGTFNEFKDGERVKEAVKVAIGEGYRMIDCAALYGNEKEVGEAISESLDEGLVERDDLFVCSKLWCWDAAPEDVEDACRRTLKDLQVEYLDCYMMHWPNRMAKGGKLVSPDFGGEFEYDVVHDGTDIDQIMETYEAMERLVGLGLVRYLGVSNMGARTLQLLLEKCDIRPLALEVEMHPYLQQPSLLELCQTEGVNVIAYSPLGKVGYRNKGDPSLLEDETILEIAEEVGKAPGQVLLRWGIQRGTTVIPKSLNPERIHANRDVLDWRLTNPQMERINALDRGFRFVSPPWFDLDKDSEYCVRGGHPGTQAFRTPCEVDENGCFRNRFERPGKYLETEIVIQRGILKNLATIGKTIVPEVSHEAHNYLVTDEIVDGLYADEVLQGFRDAGLTIDKIVIPSAAMDDSGEPSTEPYKNKEQFHRIVDQILATGVSKHTCLISLGGGTVDNITGTIAGTLYRGIKLVTIPTTTMGMCDASCDFKKAFNVQDFGKNLLGCYYPADYLVMDPDCLKSLSDRHILNGIAEALKHAVCQCTDFTKLIVDPLRDAGENRSEVFHDGDYLLRLIIECMEKKVSTLGPAYNAEHAYNEMVPQYGHAPAHAIEHLSWHHGNEPLLHGEAVAIGMCVSAEVAYLLGICKENVVDEHYEIVGATGLPCFVPDTMTIDQVLDTLKYDKHFVGGHATMGLAKEIGWMAANPENDSYAFMVDTDTLRKAFERNIERRDAAQKK